MSNVDWSWKLREAIERIKNRYSYIGRKTGAPFLAIVYSPEVEIPFFKEWRTLLNVLGPDFNVKSINLLDVTMSVVEDIGSDNILASLSNPMPGSDPETELGHLWVKAVATKVKEATIHQEHEKVVVILTHLSALYPATGPRAVMQELWDSEKNEPEVPVIILIPGTLKEGRVYSFVNQHEEFMYRGDIL